MKVDVLNKEGMVLLERSSGETLRVSLPEFWEIVRAGDRLDVRQEIENCLADGGDFNGVSADMIRGNEGFLDEVVDRVIEERLKNESGSQVYEAICYCVEHGKNKDGLFEEKSLADMGVEDFKDPERKKEFNGLMHEWRDLLRQLHEENKKPLGGDRDRTSELNFALAKARYSADVLRVKEWVSQQPYDLDVGSALYQEALELMENACDWLFPELAEMVFDGSGGDLVFREPSSTGEYTWYCFNPDAGDGGQIVGMPFDKDKAMKMLRHPEPVSIIDDRKCWTMNMKEKGFFQGMFDLLKMKEDGKFMGTDIQEVCRDIFAEHCKDSGYVMVDSVPHGLSVVNENGDFQERDLRVAYRGIAGNVEVSREDIKRQIFESFQNGRSSFELGGWDRGSVVVYCDCDLFTDEKVHFVTEESQFFYDMEKDGMGPAFEHIAERLTECVMAGELQMREGSSRESVEMSVWHGEVDVPYGFPGLDKIEDCDSMELAAPEMLRRLLKDGTGFRNVSVENCGYYNKGIGYTFSFETSLSADRAGSLVQKVLEGLRFEAWSEVKQASLGVVLEAATERSIKSSTDHGKGPETRDLGPGNVFENFENSPII